LAYGAQLWKKQPDNKRPLLFAQTQIRDMQEHSNVTDPARIQRRHMRRRAPGPCDGGKGSAAHRALVESPAYLAKRGSPRSTAELEEHDAILYSLRETD
jgi:hypothetical protein